MRNKGYILNKGNYIESGASPWEASSAGILPAPGQSSGAYVGSQTNLVGFGNVPQVSLISPTGTTVNAAAVIPGSGDVYSGNYANYVELSPLTPSEGEVTPLDDASDVYGDLGGFGVSQAAIMRQTHGLMGLKDDLMTWWGGLGTVAKVGLGGVALYAAWKLVGKRVFG